MDAYKDLDKALRDLGEAIRKHGMWSDEWELYLIVCGLVEKQKQMKLSK